MKFTPLLYVLLLAAPNLVNAQSEFICPGLKSKTTLPIGLDEYIDYKTQDGAPDIDYTNGVNCNVQFKRKKGADCELKFNCTHFDLKSKKPAPKCQDKMIISGKKYCQSIGPDVTVSGSKLKVAFKTNKKGTATGAVCTAYCVPPPPPPGNTEVSQPAISGQVQIDNGGKLHVRGNVTFEGTTGCLTIGPQNYNIDPNGTAIVPYNGICFVQEITAILIGSPDNGCKYNPPSIHSLEEKFKIEVEDTFPFPCQIIYTGTPALGITIVNFSGVPIQGFIIGKDKDGNRVSIPYGPIPPKKPEIKQTPFTLPTDFTAFNANTGQRCIDNNVPPSTRYKIQDLTNVPFCLVVLG